MSRGHRGESGFHTNTGSLPGGRTHHRHTTADRPISNEDHEVRL
jgi:hypothetical protein